MLQEFLTSYETLPWYFNLSIGHLILKLKSVEFRKPLVREKTKKRTGGFWALASPYV